MRRIIVSCFLCLLLCACSPPLRTLLGENDTSGTSFPRLLNIHIERWGEVLFSGLLALRQDGQGFYYALLDATGIKLLEVAVAANGDSRLLHAKGPLQESGLGDFLAEVLNRTYLQEPAILPCSGTWLYQVCLEEDEGKAWKKYGQSGPITLWRVTAQPGTDPKGSALIYSQVWLGVRIFLKPTKIAN